MSVKSQNERIIFGLKVKWARQEQALSFSDLSTQSGLSVSYLNEIEKGKKYPKSDKIKSLAKALGMTYEEIISPDLDRSLRPVVDLLKSNFLNDLPLELFGIDLAKVVEMIANAPARVGAFISTLLELSRNYAMNEESFYFGALRSYLQLHDNYFEDLEQAVKSFAATHDLPDEQPVPVETLEKILKSTYDYDVADTPLEQYEELETLRSVFLPSKKQLILNSNLSKMQRSFQLGKELGFNFLGIKERANTSSILKANSFEEVLNHSKAIYFSVALHIGKEKITTALQQFFNRKSWDGEAFLDILRWFEATPEMFYHRLTNVLPQEFGVRKLFFLRCSHDLKRNKFEIDRELHLNRRHRPHSNELNEHYCRRWVGLSLLEDLYHLQKEGKSVPAYRPYPTIKISGDGG